ncbi:hypothetical protein AAFF_G00239310 [Aldrovandia affinis]|uniref:Uncharacterized protein n=1 Tax=Aldrovandia affinis TaxID=143900 RepID=A0AAD7RE07_9TELE|nr:hypothetical protein AAFF_G00239310 [Aldrovandia affinis]
MSGGPTVRRQCQFVPETALSEDECKEAISLMKHSADEDIVKNKMKLTFDHRRNMILDPQQSCNILFEFPRFKDVKGLVEQDFVLMFGEGVSGKLLEKWPTAYKKKIIQECRKLPSTSELEELLLTADPPEDSTERDADFGWDSDLSSVFLLLHLIPPSAQGRRKPGKVSASQAEKHLVVFKKQKENAPLKRQLEAEDVLQDGVQADDSASQTGVHNPGSVCSRGSRVSRSTVESRVSVTRVRQEAEHAALLERAAALKRRQQLEQEEAELQRLELEENALKKQREIWRGIEIARIKAKKEELEMETALAESSAKLKVLNESRKIRRWCE